MQLATALGDTNHQHPKHSANKLANKMCLIEIAKIWSLLRAIGRSVDFFFFSTFYRINNISNSEMGEWGVYTFMQLQIIQAKYSHKTGNAFFNTIFTFLFTPQF